MQPERKIGMLLSEMGIDGELKEAIMNLILIAIDIKQDMKEFEQQIYYLQNRNTYPWISRQVPEKGIHCGFCDQYFKEYPHYCKDHITVSHQTRYWIDDQAYNASHRIPNCS